MSFFKKNFDSFEILTHLNLLYKQLNKKAIRFQKAEKNATDRSKAVSCFFLMIII